MPLGYQVLEHAINIICQFNKTSSSTGIIFKSTILNDIIFYVKIIISILLYHFILFQTHRYGILK